MNNDISKLLADQIAKKFKSGFSKTKKIKFSDICNNDTEIELRNSKISVKDLAYIFFNKINNQQFPGLQSILNDLDFDKFSVGSCSRSVIHNRCKHINPKKLQNKLLHIFFDQGSSEFIRCIFDGSGLTLNNSQSITQKYSKSKARVCNVDILSRQPIGKIHYLMSEDENVCLNACILNNDSGERTTLVKLAISAYEIGQKLDIMADRGLYGGTIAYILNELGHKFALRLGGSLYNIIKKKMFKKNELIIQMNIHRDAIETYKKDFPDIKPGKFIVRVVRKKGNSKHKPIYITTNEYEKSPEEILERYFKRQRIEDNFKYLKSYGGIEKVHPNTGRQMLELIVVFSFIYISLIQYFLSLIIKTPGPNEDGANTANRKSIWKTFLKLIYNNFNRNTIIKAIRQTNRFSLKIRSNRSEIRYKKTTRIRIIQKKKTS